MRRKRRRNKRVWLDPYYCNTAHLCFTSISEDDKRWLEFKQQRKLRGFDDSELWLLKDTIASFIIPRLRRYLDVSKEHTTINEKDRESMEFFLLALKLLRKNTEEGLSKEEKSLMEEGLSRFPRIIHRLWW